MARFDGKVAWVTGGASGIGRAICLRLASEGAKVMVSDVVDGGGEGTVALIAEAGGTAEAVPCDVTKLADCQSAVAAIDAAWGRLDCAAANAGIVSFGTVEDGEEDDFLRVVDIDLLGVFRTAKVAIPLITRSGGGALVFTSSVEGLVGSAMIPAYCSAKTGLLGLCRSVAQECGPVGIRVNCVNPGFIESPMTRPRDFEGSMTTYMTERTPMGRVGQPEDIAGVVAFLCSDDASYVSGQWLAVDGGMTSIR